MPATKWSRVFASVLALAGLAACNGEIGAPTAPLVPPGSEIDPKDPNPIDPIVPPPTCVTPSPGPAPMRRLSNTEYRYTIEDLLGDAALAQSVSASFVSETQSLGFRNNAEFLQVSQIVAQNFMDAAETLALEASQTAALIPCAIASGDAACASQFIRDFGKRAYRRPLSAEEIARYEAMYATASTDYDFATGIEWIVFAMLQSPRFLYRVELGLPSNDAYTRPDQYEMASRLSYLLWASMPDDTLLAAAEAGALSTKAEIEAQARRMLADPKARRGVQFFDEWLDLDDLAAIQRDTTVFPNTRADLAELLRAETHKFVESVVYEGDGQLDTLLTAPYTYLNGPLAQHYGVSGVTGAELVRVDLDPTQHAGILTQGGVVAVHDKPTRTSIVKRGLKIRTDFFCQTIGAPPNDVILDLPPISRDVTQRQRLEMHRTNATCAACHTLMDPIGVVFESFDALGRYRTVDEAGVPVQTQSELTATRDINGPVADAPDLARKMSGSEGVRACFQTQLFRFASGRVETPMDRCSKEQLATRFESTNYNVVELLVGLTQTDAFLYRPTTVP